MNKEKLDTFLTQENCDRCGDKLVVRTMSWFTDETICEKCSDQEIQFKTNINKIGLYHGDYEGCGKDKYDKLKRFVEDKIKAMNNEKWLSCAVWPKGTCSPSDDFTTDTHSSQSAAKGVCELLHKEGFGGEKKIFPIKTWVAKGSANSPFMTSTNDMLK